jgi:hypothetical protein
VFRIERPWPPRDLTGKTVAPAFNSGTAIQNRPPGSPGVGTPFG